jgi:predicted ABC-type transport system involved in lysophospholipase L1 biosynthesis ATPase subunit
MIQDLFFQLKESLGLALVVVTHDPNFSRKFGKVHRISDGRWV